MKPATKIYVRDLSIGMVVYAILLIGSNLYASDHHDLAKWHLVMLAAAPMAGVFMALRAMLIFIGQMDELQRKNIMDAVVVAFTLTAMGTFAYGFLEGVGFPKMDTHFVFVFLVGGMGLAQVYTCWWRYK